MEKLESPKAANAQINGQNTAYTTPPNGGLQAWLQVTGSFFLFFNSWYYFHATTLYFKAFF